MAPLGVRTVAATAAAFLLSPLAFAQEGPSHQDLAATQSESQPATTPNAPAPADEQTEESNERDEFTDDPPRLDADPSRWNLNLAAYLWLPALDGTMTLKGRSVDVSLDADEVFDAVIENFNVGFALHMEATKDQFTIFTDAMFLSLEFEARGRILGLGQVDALIDQGIFELGGAYAVLDQPIGKGESRLRLEPLAGARIVYLATDLDFRVLRDVDDEKAWMDVFAGARARLSFNRNVSLVARCDIGAGGSDFTWSALGGLQFQMGERCTLTAGYRAIDIDYDESSGTGVFGFDMLMHGPFVALTLRF